jgi:hypothetical protein
MKTPEEMKIQRAKWAMETARLHLEDAAKAKTREQLENSYRLADTWMQEADKRLRGSNELRALVERK